LKGSVMESTENYHKFIHNDKKSIICLVKRPKAMKLAKL
jgi:hypothetical protein